MSPEKLKSVIDHESAVGTDLFVTHQFTWT
jgi:hypothetical protein